MEFGSFDDDLFTENEKKPKKSATVDYKPKTVTPQWYTEEEAIPKDDVDKVHFYIFRGNRHYYQGAWSCALEAYTRAMDYVAPNNSSMRRLLLESLARCRWRCGDANEAVEMGKKLVEESTNDHQLFGAHSVLAMFYDAAGNKEDQALSLRLCLDKRPLSVQHWIQLAKIYLKEIQSKDYQRTYQLENASELKRHIGQFNDKESTGSCNSQCSIESTGNDISANAQSRPSADNDLTAQCDGDQGRSKGLDKHRHLKTEDSIHKDAQDGQAQNAMGRNSFSDGTCSNVNGESCESRHLNHNSLLASGSVKFGLGPEAGENVHRQSPTSAVGQDTGVLESEKLERLSINGEDTAMAKDFNSLDEDIGGRGNQEGDGDLVIQAVACLLKAQVILKSLQICAVSLTKMRNAQLLAEIDGLLSTLHLDPAFVQDMSKKMYNEVFDKDIKEESAVS